MAAQAGWLAALALVVNALVWGLSWWPFRHLEGLGIHPLWTTALVYGAIAILLVLWRPAALRELCRPTALWVLVVAAGTTNASFNWAVSIGDVVRVVLLFYLMPLWAVLLALWLLHEPITPRALMRVLLGLFGAALVLWPSGADTAATATASAGLADGLAILGGFTFALNNIMVRREHQRSESARALAMFLGGGLVAGGLAALLWQAGQVPAVQWSAWPQAWPLAVLLVGSFLVANLCLQYGASRLPAQRTAVIMLTEIVFASVSAVWLDAGTLTPMLWLGGLLILLSAWLAAGD